MTTDAEKTLTERARALLREIDEIELFAAGVDLSEKGATSWCIEATRKARIVDNRMTDLFDDGLEAEDRELAATLRKSIRRMCQSIIDKFRLMEVPS